MSDSLQVLPVYFVSTLHARAAFFAVYAKCAVFDVAVLWSLWAA